MQTDLDYLPENKRAELAEVVRLIREEAAVEEPMLQVDSGNHQRQE